MKMDRLGQACGKSYMGVNLESSRRPVQGVQNGVEGERNDTCGCEAGAGAAPWLMHRISKLMLQAEKPARYLDFKASGAGCLTPWLTHSTWGKA